MGEIININIGQFGCEVGTQYINKLVYDHSDNENNLNVGNVHKSFEEHNNQYYYRGLFLEEDFHVNDLIKTNYQIRSKINKNSIFPQSKNLFQCEYQLEFEESLRKLQEECNSHYNINMIHSSFDYSCGCSTQIIKILNDQYKFISTNTLIPTLNAQVIEIYNFIFSMNILIEQTQYCIIYDYDALQKQTIKLLQNEMIQNYQDIISETILQNNCGIRFAGNINGYLNKFATNLIDFPRIHFLTCSFSLLNNHQNINNQIQTISNQFNSYLSYPQDIQNIYRSQGFISRTNTKQFDIEFATSRLQFTSQQIPYGILNINCKQNHRLYGETIMHIGNHSMLGIVFKNFWLKLLSFIRKRVYMHYYFQQGIDELEFQEAEQNFADLISEYVIYSE